MIKNLFPYFYVQPRHMKICQLMALDSGFCYIIRKKGQLGTSLEDTGDETGITEFQKRCDLHGSAGQILIQQLLIAGTAFCKDKRLADQCFP